MTDDVQAAAPADTSNAAPAVAAAAPAPVVVDQNATVDPAVAVEQKPVVEPAGATDLQAGLDTEQKPTVEVKLASQAGEGTDDMAEVAADPALAADNAALDEQDAFKKMRERFPTESDFVAWIEGVDARLAKVETDLGTALENLGHVLSDEFKSVWAKVKKFAPFTGK